MLMNCTQSVLQMIMGVLYLLCGLLVLWRDFIPDANRQGLFK